MAQIPDGKDNRLRSTSWIGWTRFVAYSCALLLGAAWLNAQVTNGISGTVTDPSGAAIPGAGVTVTNEATGVTTQAVTTGVGSYAVTGLNPGFFTVTVEVKGFQKFSKSGINVEVGTPATIDIQMVPGSATQTVNVVSHSIALDTTQPDVGTTLEPKVLDALPVEISGNVRQIDQFIFLSPGVQGSTFSREIDGGTNFENEVLFNGIPIAMPNLEGQQTYMNPPYEMVNEFRVERATFAAQYGLGQGSTGPTTWHPAPTSSTGMLSRSTATACSIPMASSRRTSTLRASRFRPSTTRTTSASH